MANGSITRVLDDDLVGYMYVERAVVPVCAFRYRSYVGDLPHAFARTLREKYSNTNRTECVLVNTSTDLTDRTSTCRHGDWIVLESSGTVVMSDEDFMVKYRRARD